MIDALLAPFYKWIILVLLLFMTGYVWYCNSLAGDLRNAETACDVSVAKTIKPYEDAIDQAQKEKATIMQTWSAKIIEVEQNAIKKIQDANAAARSADLAAIGLSKQLSEANKRLSTAPKEIIIEYTVTNSELLETCTAEYRGMAEKADGHAIDAMRLSESWPEEIALR
ncbi:hypothetical protein F994_02445 [Acinetobacter bohemicus ANC 3994]|uniref:DUF2514 domain-containing protein n=1 Tax=Acinetobacter bohemicus ANC 3994 TaxID=1217715 RepID=N8NZK5_9GAMM|nr:hypothetical protein [Acinetobacter bohemicus]ENU19585.1 hypothetical protein F994_02445 [Acinetobacter bohemicus ANC 3994]